MRLALRRTQKQVEQERAAAKASKSVDDMDYRELQGLATERGINARQSTEALRDALR